MRAAFLAILILAYSRTIVAQTPLVIKWKTETPLSIATGDPIDTRLAIDPQGNILRVLHTGYTADTTLTKFTPSGQLLFEKTWSTPQPNYNPFFLQTFSVDHDGNSILLILENNAALSEGILHYVSYDANGTLRWDKPEHIPSQSNLPFFRAAAVDIENNIIFVGSMSNIITAQKISPTGELLWRYSPEFPGVSSSSATDVALDSAGLAYVTGGGNISSGQQPFSLIFGANIIGDFWTDSTPRKELANIHITESGAIYVTDPTTLFRINSAGKTDWFRSIDGGYPQVIAVTVEEAVVVLSPDAFTIWDKAGNPLGAGRFSTPYNTEKAQAHFHTIFISRGPRILELRPEGSFISDTNFADGYSVVQDIALAESLDLAFVGIKSDTTSARTVVTGVFTHTTDPGAPNILKRPAGAVLPVGADFTTSVTATGSNLKYQWFFESSPNSRIQLEGQTNSSLQLTNLNTNHSGKYSVQVSNSLGAVYSSYADLAVHIVPKITANPSATPSRPYVGDRVTWKFSATYSSPVGFQWFKDGVPIPRATNFSYTIPVSSPSDVGNYSVLVTNLVGEAKTDETPFPIFLHNVAFTTITNELLFFYGDLAKDSQNDVYFAGGLSISNKLTAIAAKFDANGELLWTNALFQFTPYLKPSSDTIYASLAPNGATLILGTTNSTPVLCKIDAAGTVSWMTSLKTNLNSTGAVQAGDLYSYVAGLRTALPKKAFVVIAFNSDGTQARTTSIDYTLTANDPISWLAPGADRIYMASRALKTLYAINLAGDIIWTNSLSTNTIIDMKAGPANSIYLLTQNLTTAACVKINSEGQLVWTTPVRRSARLNTETAMIEVDALGNAYIISTVVGAAPQASFVIKIDPDGRTLSQWTPRATYSNRGNLRTTDNDVAFVIRYEGDLPSLAKYDANGVRRWSRPLSSQTSAVAMIPVTDRDIFVLTPRKLLKFQDLETPEMQQVTPTIERGILSTNPVLRVHMDGAVAQKVTWYLNALTTTIGVPTNNPTDTIIPRFSSIGSYYSAEIETEDAILATPDHFFDVFSMINDAQAADGALHLNLTTLSSFGFRLQRSHNLIDWEDYTATTSNADGTSEITIPINNQQQTEYFRAIK